MKSKLPGRGTHQREEKNVMSDITDYEAQQIEQTNTSRLTPVVFIHGLWPLPNSWDRWRAVFEDAGYATLVSGWPDDPNTVEDANKHPEVFAHKTVGQIADHFGDVIGRLTNKPALLEHLGGYGGS
jgi:non-heme chloroperoxidase